MASNRPDGPFVSINCAAIPKELFESEVFGYVPGAFSGAHKDGKIGQIELADQGTLFLDEVGDLPLHAQVKLLRVLEEKTLSRLGSSQPRAVDFRLVAATNRDLKKMIAAGTFREDLYLSLINISSSRNGESVSNAATGGNCASLRSEGISSRSAAASLPVAVSSEAAPARASHADSTCNAFTVSVSAVSEASTCNLIGTSPERSPSLPFFAA